MDVNRLVGFLIEQADGECRVVVRFDLFIGLRLPVGIVGLFVVLLVGFVDPLLLFLLLFFELLLSFLFGQRLLDGDLDGDRLREVVCRQLVVLGFDPNPDGVAVLQAERLQRKIVLERDLLLRAIEQRFVSDVVRFASDLQDDGAEFEVLISRHDDQRDRAVGRHFEIGRWVMPLQAEMASLKTQAYVSETDIEDTHWFRLRVGPFSTRMTAPRQERRAKSSQCCPYLMSPFIELKSRIGWN